ncbi:hypothetical protein ACQJBY_048744 [Aegilops geniculata]
MPPLLGPQGPAAAPPGHLRRAARPRPLHYQATSTAPPTFLGCAVRPYVAAALLQPASRRATLLQPAFHRAVLPQPASQCDATPGRSRPLPQSVHHCQPKLFNDGSVNKSNGISLNTSDLCSWY